MSTEPDESPKFSIFERTLAYLAVAIMLLAVVMYITTLIVGIVAGREALADSLWPIVAGISYVGLPVGFVLLVVLLIINYTKRQPRRSRPTQQ